VDTTGRILPPPPQHEPLRWWFDASAGSVRRDTAISLELRWFGRGEPPPGIRELTADGRSESRMDHYALLARDDVSIKLRGRSRLAIKQRRCRVALADDLPVAERWTRRSARTPQRWLTDGSSWFAIHKHRAQVVVDLSDETPVWLASRRRSLPRGGALELVQLEVPGGRSVWSVACETWGPSDATDLVRLLQWTAVDWRAVDDAASLSGGYPSALPRLDPSLA
jgi:hypothetical protein